MKRKLEIPMNDKVTRIRWDSDAATAFPGSLCSMPQRVGRHEKIFAHLESFQHSGLRVQTGDGGAKGPGCQHLEDRDYPPQDLRLMAATSRLAAN